MSKIDFMSLKTIDFCDDVRDGTHDSPKHLDSGKLLITSKNIKGDSIDFENASYISDEDYNKINERSLVEINDVLYSMIGTVGLVYRVDQQPNYAIKNMGLFKIHDELKSKWLYYYLNSPKAKGKVLSMLSGSTQKFISLSNLRNLEIEFPQNIDDAKRIIKICESIDKKIKLNNEINNNLHELCNNMYFELVSQLDDSNSSSKQIKEVSKCVLGGTPSRAKNEYWNGNINWINSGEVNKFRIIDASEKITELGLQKSSTALLPKGTTVLAITGATLGQVSRLEIDSCANQSVIGIIPNNIELNNYIYLSIFNTINDLILKQTGGAQQHINKNDVETHEIIIPNDKLLKEFYERTRLMFDKISITCFENKRLEQLRDTLLPKLMNGEIDLDNIEI